MEKQDLNDLKKKIAELSELEQKQRDLYLRQLAVGEIQGPSVEYSSINKNWFKYYDADKIEETIPKKSIYQLAYESNKNNLDQVAIDLRISKNDFTDGIKITYDEFFKNVYAAPK